jgi:hypothetical protein
MVSTGKKTAVRSDLILEARITPAEVFVKEIGKQNR